MDEQLYSIPVNDAFNQDSECPVCRMYAELQKNAIEFVMGPSYMEDDVRMETNKTGFCGRHVELMYEQQNRLGLALMLHTHMQEVIKQSEKLQKKGRASGGGLFKKATEMSPVAAYMKQLGSSCYVCDRIERIFKRYIDTMFYLYRKESAFREKFAGSKGFCAEHYGLVYEEAPKQLRGRELEEFTALIDRLFLDNMKRVCDDIEWYTDKFDYRNADAPWKNSKDAVPRTVLKLNGIEIKS